MVDHGSQQDQIAKIAFAVRVAIELVSWTTRIRQVGGEFDFAVTHPPTKAGRVKHSARSGCCRDRVFYRSEIILEKSDLLSTLGNLDELRSIPEALRTDHQQKAIFKMQARVRDSRAMRVPLPKWWVLLERNDAVCRAKIMECVNAVRRKSAWPVA